LQNRAAHLKKSVKALFLGALFAGDKLQKIGRHSPKRQNRAEKTDLEKK